MRIREFQDLMKEFYFTRDQKRGAEKTFIWLTEEIGELARYFNKSLDKKEVESELADVLAWLTSLANLLGVDLERAVTQKYGEKCPRCKKKPCDCEFR